MRATAWIGLTLAAALLLAQVFLPPYVEERIKGAVAAAVPESERINVHIRALPATKMVAGWLDSVAVDLLGPTVGGVDLEWFSVRGRALRVDVPAIFERRLHIRDAAELRVEAAISAESLTLYIQSLLGTLSQVDVRFHPGMVEVSAPITLLGSTTYASVSGRVTPAGDTRLRFVPEAATIDGEAVPQLLVEVVRALFEWELDLSSLPFPVRVDGVDVTPERLVAHGEWITE